MEQTIIKEANKQQMKTPLEWALFYASKGWAVFPCNLEKAPLIKREGKEKGGFYKATTDPEKVTEFFTKYPNANIGVATGKVSNLFLLDIDIKKGNIGDQSLHELESQYGKLPHTISAITWSGGQHYFFKYPECGMPNVPFIRPGIEIKGDGGYAIVTPSKYKGECGEGAYCWEVSSCPEDTELADAPEWLLKIVLDILSEKISTDPAEKTAGDISITDVLSKANISTKTIGGQLVCSHPVHGSTNNNNFVVHPDKNVWRCFRCNTGGGPLSLIAVLEKVIDCSEARSGGLKGEKFIEACRIAKEKYGFDVKVKSRSQSEQILSDDEIATLETRIKTISKDTPRTKIPGMLSLILKDIAMVDATQSDALLKDTVKKHFGFTNYDLKSYETLLNRYRKESKDIDYGDAGIHIKVADQILKDHRLLYCANDFYEYTDGYYKKISEETVHKWVKALVGDKFRRCLTEEVLFLLQTEAHIDQGLLNKGDYLNLKNGLFNIDTGKTSDHSPEDYSIIRLGVNYNPKAICKKWIDTVYQIFDKDEDKISTLQEFFGLCLTREVRYEKALWMIGEGANGKSTLLFILEKLIGEANRTAIPLEKLSNMHYVANLHGKLVNISVETNAKSEVYDSTFKQIVSGDPVTADRKFEQEFTFNPFCKLIYALNNMPRVNDKTPAFFRRLLILPFEIQFTDDIANKNLKFELLEELDGIFLWCLEGLRNLRARGYFKIYPKMQAEIEAYRQENNNVLLYGEERFIFEPAAQETKHAVYFDFSEWCKSNNYKPMSAIRFGKELKKQFRNIKDARDNFGEKIWEGIRLQIKLGGSKF